MGIQEEFYDSLRREYKLEGERSFLYRYFLDRPRQQRGGAKESDVHRAIRTFLYDTQHGRRKDQSLAMLNAYCAHRGISSLLAGGVEMDWAEAEAFCNALRAEGNTSILLPLKIDPCTGAGLYLMGSDFLSEAKLYTDRACCYACLWMDDLKLEKEDGQYVWSICSRERNKLEEQCGFPNLTEALRWFQNLTSMDHEAYQVYSITNGPAPPNCPPALLRYFEAGQEESELASLIAQGRESFAREEINGEP